MTSGDTYQAGPSGQRPVHRLRRELQESHNRYELVAKATNDVIYDLDIEQGTVFWNDAM